MAEKQKIVFGNYPQGEGDEKLPITWLILTECHDKKLIISELALDCQPYNQSCEDTSWDLCSINQWLNKEFYNNSFSAAEKNSIINTSVSVYEPVDTSDPHSMALCKVFLLSAEEAMHYFSNAEERKCLPTAYAKISGTWSSPRFIKNGEPTCYWWLRTGGLYKHSATCINCLGEFGALGYIVSCDWLGIRPAMWIKK